MIRVGPIIRGTISLGIDVMRHRHERRIIVVVVVVRVGVMVVGRSVNVDAAPEAVSIPTPNSGLFALARLRQTRFGIDELSQKHVPDHPRIRT
jgi:hypothetical protein